MEYIGVSGNSYDVHEQGYQIISSILCSRPLIVFSVPCHALDEILKSNEWEAFDNLLEKVQVEDIQNRHQIEKVKQETLNCKETSDQRLRYRVYGCILQRILGKVQKIFRILQ